MFSRNELLLGFVVVAIVLIVYFTEPQHSLGGGLGGNLGGKQGLLEGVSCQVKQVNGSQKMTYTYSGCADNLCVNNGKPGSSYVYYLNNGDNTGTRKSTWSKTGVARGSGRPAAPVPSNWDAVKQVTINTPMVDSRGYAQITCTSQ
jgi:hypothetical protein